MKKIARLMSVALVVLMTFMMATSFAFGNITSTPQAPTGAETTASNIIGYMQWIGYAIAVGMLVYIGIKYIMASADEKASMKGLIVKVVIGSLIIIFAKVIVNMVLSVAST